MDETSALAQIKELLGDVPATTIPFIKCVGQRAGWLKLVAACGAAYACECPDPIILLLSEKGKDGKTHGAVCTAYAAAAAAAPKGNTWQQVASWALTGGVVNFNDPLGPSVPSGKTGGACSGCRPDQPAGVQAATQTFKGRPLWPGARIVTERHDIVADGQTVIARPTMVLADDGFPVWTAQVAFDGCDSADCEPPAIDGAAMAPGWTPALVKASWQSIRVALIAADSLDDQPAANLAAFWAAVQKHAPGSTGYYLSAGVPPVAGVKSGAGHLQPMQLALVAGLAYLALRD